jgi:chromate reductase
LISPPDISSAIVAAVVNGEPCGSREFHPAGFARSAESTSIPGVLKNAIDHASRPYGQSAWAGKPAGVIGISFGAIGTAVAQQHLRTILAYLDVPTLGQPEAFIQAKEGLFEADGSIGTMSRQFLQGWMDRYVAWIKQHAA